MVMGFSGLVNMLRNYWSEIVVYSVFLIFLSYRAYFVAFVSTAASGYSFSEMVLMTLSNDLLIILLFICLEVIVSNARVWLVSFLSRITIVISVCAFSIDVFVFKYMANRLNVDDVFQYGGEMSVIREMIDVVSATNFGMLGLVLALLLLLSAPRFFLLPSPLSILSSATLSGVKRLIIVVVAVVGSFSTISYASVSSNNGNLLQLRVGNVFYALSSYSYKNKYSSQYVEQYADITQSINKSKLCVQGRDEERNVIMVVVESLSSYHSDFFSGIYNYTPKIDSIAANNIAFKNFHSNGFTTVGGYMALFNGLLPIPKTFNEHTEARGGWVSLSGYETNPFSVSLPEMFNKNEYETIFLSNSGLDFAGSLQWLKNIGFKDIQDANSQYYDGYKRYLFNAPSDEAVFDIAKQHVTEANEKYLMVISTISTHRPYVDVETGEATTEEASFRQLDKVLGAFYEHLDETGYFDNGIMLITGDHRAMTPPLTEEENLYGKGTGNRVPMILIDKMLNAPEVIDNEYQHVDVFASLKTFVSVESCRVALYGDFYSADNAPPACVFFARGDNRNLVSVSCDNQQADILLDGDDTRVIKGEIDKELSVIEIINSLRIN